MPSGPKKRRAVRRKMKDEANINEHNATKSEEMTGIIGHTSVEGYNSSIKNVAADDLLVPANNISKGTGNIHNEVAQEDVILGSKQIEEKAMASVNEYTSDSPIVSGLNKSYEAMLSKEKVCIDNKPVQESLMESREADLSEEENEAPVLAEDIKVAQDVLMENEEAALYNVVVHTDYSITSPYDEFVSKEIENNENTSDSSMVIFLAMKEDEAAVLAEDIKVAQDVLKKNEEAALYNVVVHTDYSITSPYDEFISKENENNENTSDSSMVIFSTMKEDEAAVLAEDIEVAQDVLKENEEAALYNVVVHTDYSITSPYDEFVSKENENNENTSDSMVIFSAMKEDEAAVLAEDIKVAQDVLKENEEVALYNVVHTDYSITSPYDEFVSKEIKNNENTSDSSMVIFSAMKDDEKDSPSVYQEAEALASSIAMDFVAKENEYNILQTSEAVTSSEQIHYACPLHSRSGCIFCHWFGGQSDGEYSSEDKNTSYKGMNSKMLLEHIKKTVEAELYAADKVVFLLRKFLDDLNAIDLQMDHYLK